MTAKTQRSSERRSPESQSARAGVVRETIQERSQEPLPVPTKNDESRAESTPTARRGHPPKKAETATVNRGRFESFAESEEVIVEVSESDEGEEHEPDAGVESAPLTAKRGSGGLRATVSGMFTRLRAKRSR